MKHRQLVLLMCGLMSDPIPIILYVCKHWMKDGQGSAGKTLIGLMYYEAALPVPKDFLHNQWINYYDHIYGLIKDKSPVYVPSRLYWFENMSENISCNIQNGNPDTPECNMSIINPYPSVTNNLLSICHRICQHQAVRKLILWNITCEDLPEPHVFTISRNMELLRIYYCELPKETPSHLIQQINQYSALRVLDVYKTPLRGCLSSFLPDPHPGLPELKELDMWDTILNKEDLQHLLSIAYKFPKLHKLDLSENTLTGYLSNLLPDPHPGLLELRELKLSSTQLNKEDLHHLSYITQHNKLPLLRCLNLSGNTLTGCLSSVIPDPHPGLPELESLDLCKTKLNKEDLHHLSYITQSGKLPKIRHLDLSWTTLTGCLLSIIPDNHQGLPELEELNLRRTALSINDLQHLSQITQCNKLPKLEVLYLSQNILTGCLSSFLSDPHPGLPQLKELYMWNTTLNTADLEHLTHLIQKHKLPGLKDLNLVSNSFCKIEKDVEHLIEACVDHHQTELKLRLWRNCLSDDFEKKWKQRCAGTKIELEF